MRLSAAAYAVLLTALVGSSALADGDQQYFIVMRAPDVDPTPRYVSVGVSQIDDQSVAMTVCDGNTYYLTPDDAATVNAALSYNNTVQLQVAPVGGSAQTSSVVCLIQASP